MIPRGVGDLITEGERLALVARLTYLPEARQKTIGRQFPKGVSLKPDGHCTVLGMREINELLRRGVEMHDDPVWGDEFASNEEVEKLETLKAELPEDIVRNIDREVSPSLATGRSETGFPTIHGAQIVRELCIVGKEHMMHRYDAIEKIFGDFWDTPEERAILRWHTKGKRSVAHELTADDVLTLPSTLEAIDKAELGFVYGKERTVDQIELAPMKVLTGKEWADILTQTKETETDMLTLCNGIAVTEGIEQKAKKLTDVDPRVIAQVLRVMRNRHKALNVSASSSAPSETSEQDSPQGLAPAVTTEQKVEESPDADTPPPTGSAPQVATSMDWVYSYEPTLRTVLAALSEIRSEVVAIKERLDAPISPEEHEVLEAFGLTK